ncbi:glycosyltransferase family 4 protein [Catenovulum sp. 2E275]|uniref:glycosyltransferase n=1 Tax=Catenovulum sp. 2E275 TaxID=2980497 RepID=UPI0021D113C9|nr:glycosyltransferase family 4 protein [Catenovulum sp. 2E275]MCU4675497.1 glycosyltransferase family 4 protein [Catenovulum sp. 2E275]
MKKLLVIGYVWPEPNSSAAGRYMLNLLNFFLALDYQIHFASPAAESEHRFEFEQLGIQKVEIKLNSSCFDQYICELQPNVVLFDRFMMEEQFGWRVAKYCPNALRLLDLEDLQSLRKARQQALKQARTVVFDDFQSDIGLREIAAIWRCDMAFVISKYEMTLLQTQFNLPANKLFYLPFTIDSTPVIEDLLAYTNKHHFICIGNFRHEPNWDAVLYLKEKIWPLIRKELKQAELHIYGAYPPKKATQLNNPKQGFLVKGWAKDAMQVMQNAKVCLAPLRFGAGLKGKLFEAMLAGTPSITTPIGAEAMSGDFNWPGKVEDSAEKLAQAAIDVYEDEANFKQYQQLGLDILNREYLTQPFFESFKIKLNELAQNLAHHRADNFTGAMLMHHTMKSTQYMAQWIEAKNKLI